MARADLDARTSAVFLEIRQAQIALRSAQSRIKLYRDTLLPQAEANFSASASAYENNRGEFTNLIDSQNLLLDIRTAYYQACLLYTSSSYAVTADPSSTRPRVAVIFAACSRAAINVVLPLCAWPVTATFRTSCPR